MRLFVGLPLPDPLRELAERLQAALPVGRPVDTDALHLTLAFLGPDVPETVAEEIHLALEGRRLGRATLHVTGLAALGGAAPKLIALEVLPSADLVALQRDVVRAASAAGWEVARRRFRPHVTLARFGSGLPAPGQGRLRRALEGIQLPRSESTEARVATLVRSHLAPGGARYETLAQYMLV